MTRCSSRLHAFGKNEPPNFFAAEKSDEVLGGGPVLSASREPGDIDNDVLQFSRERPDQFGALYGKDRHDLLHADLGLAAGDQFRYRAAGEVRLRLRLLCNAEALQEIGDIG